MQIKITIGGKTVDTRMLTVREYLGIIEAYQAGSPENAVNDAIESRFGELPKHLAEQAFIELVALSKNKTIKLKTNCTCGKEHKFELNPNAIGVTESPKLDYRVGGLVIHLRHPKMFEDRDHFEMLDRCIVSFEYDDQITKWGEATDAEKDLVFRHLTFDHIREMIHRLVSCRIYAAVPVVCECGNQWPAVIEGPDAILEALGVK